MIHKREISKSIESFLENKEIIVLHGARQVGKTTILKYLIEKLNKQKVFSIYHDLEDQRFLDIYNQDIDSIINFWKSIGVKEKQKNFIFIDEIQYLQNPSSFLKLTHDHYPYIKLIVSGSSSFAIKSKFKDSLVGRTIDFEIFGLSFNEFLLFKNIDFNLIKKSKFNTDKLKQLWTEFCLFGSYPQIVLEQNIEKKELLLMQIIRSYIEKDVAELANIKNITKFNKLISLLAAQSGQLLNVKEISNSLQLAEATVNDYLFILENTYIIKKVYPFSKNIRSELTKMPKVFFEDTGIVNILQNKQLITIMNGQLFENACFSYLRKKYNPKYLSFWRTNTQKEIDFIINQQELTALECKLTYKGKKDEKQLKYFQKYYPNSIVKIINFNQIASGSIQNFYPWEI